MTAKIDAALSSVLAKVRSHYGARAKTIYRIDRNSDIEDSDRSDAEIVVVLSDGSWRGLQEQRALGKLTFDTLMEHDVYVRAWPVPVSAWHDPALAEHPGLVQEFRKHAQEFSVSA